MPTISSARADVRPIRANATAHSPALTINIGPMGMRRLIQSKLNAVSDDVIAGSPITSPRQPALNPNAASRWLGSTARKTPKITANANPPPTSVPRIARFRSASPTPPSWARTVKVDSGRAGSSITHATPAVTTPRPHGASAHRHPTASVTSPDTIGNVARAAVSTPEFLPIQ